MAQRSARPAAVRGTERLAPSVAQLVLLVLAAVLTIATAAFYVPRQIASDAFAGAPACTASAPADADCIARTPVTMSLRGQSGTGDNAVLWVDVLGIGAGVTQVNLHGGSAGWAQLQPGERGTALIWRGLVVELVFGSSVLQTPDWPDVRTMRVLWSFVPAVSLTVSGIVLWLVPRRPRHQWILDLSALCIPCAGVLYALISVLVGRPAPLLLPPVFAGVAALGFGSRQVSRLLWMRRVRRQTRALIAR
jgi:hypothetical protein